jgi:hypothetical protein
MKRLAYEGAILLPMAVPLTLKVMEGVEGEVVVGKDEVRGIRGN